MIRIFDFFLALSGLLITSPLIAFIFLSLLITRVNPVFAQKRVGKNKIEFILYKFRTMKINTKSKATHLISSNQITIVGSFLRKSKLDELPQLWNVLIGEMSLVGPRPCLQNQVELINLRSKYQVFSVRPGITGLAQINSIDMSSPVRLAQTDAKMINKLTLLGYFYYIFMTIIGKGIGDRIKL